MSRVRIDFGNECGQVKPMKAAAKAAERIDKWSLFLFPGWE